jgi:hypothetical protein
MLQMLGKLLIKRLNMTTVCNTTLLHLGLPRREYLPLYRIRLILEVILISHHHLLLVHNTSIDPIHPKLRV